MRSISRWRLMGAAIISVGVMSTSILSSYHPSNTFAATQLKLSDDKTTWTSFFNAEGQAAMSATGVGWKTTPYADTTTYQAAIRTSGQTNKVPDLYTWWSGWLMKDIVDAGLAADVSSLWNKYKSAYSKGLRKVFTFNGKTYGLPVNVAYWVILYNKHVFSKYHLSAPSTWAQFMNINKTLRSHSVTPLAATIDGRWPGFIYFEELLVRSNPKLYTRLMAGKAKYSDPGVVKVMNLWASMIKEGDFTDPGKITFGTGTSNLLSLFKQGKVGMVQIGTWYEPTFTTAGILPGRDYGAFIMPNINPSAGKNLIFEAGPMVVAAHGSNLSAAMKAADYFMSKPGQDKWIKLTGFIPARNDVSATNQVDDQLVKMVTTQKYHLLNRYWEATPHDIVEVAVDQFDKFMLHPNDPMSILQTIQHQADQSWAQNR